MGCAFGGRPLRKRSAHTSRGSYDPPGRTRRLSRGAKGHRWSIGNRHAVRVMRRARVALPITWCREVTSWTAGERSDTETVTLREARGGWKRALARVPRQSPTQLQISVLKQNSQQQHEQFPCQPPNGKMDRERIRESHQHQVLEVDILSGQHRW